MTTRHRYTGFVDGLCGQTFGGVARCHLPLKSVWHYSDVEHPFSPNPDYPEECGWALQSSEGVFCSADVGEQMHQLRADPVPPEGLRPITVTNTIPLQEAPVNKDWQHGNVYPPSDDAVGEAPTEKIEVSWPSRVEGLPTEVLKQEADQYRWDSGDKPVTGLPRDTGDEQPEWSRAVGWLQDPRMALTYGPWPVRKYVILDAALIPGRTEGQGALRAAMECLDGLEKVYSLDVSREDGQPWRIALLTWDWALGLDMDSVCDELAALYG